jgi:hypothetical protein
MVIISGARDCLIFDLDVIEVLFITATKKILGAAALVNKTVYSKNISVACVPAGPM